MKKKEKAEVTKYGHPHRVLITPFLIQVSTLPCRKQYTVGVLMYGNSPFLFLFSFLHTGFLKLSPSLKGREQMAGEGLYSSSRGKEGKVKM